MFETYKTVSISRSHYALAAGLVLLLAAGCGGDAGEVRNEKMAKVAGVVTYQGKPVNSGTVTLSNPTNGFAASGEIGLAGKFEITLVPVGDYRVNISPPMPKEAVEESALPDAPTDIPIKFQNAETSGVQASVPAEGVKDLKIDLE